MHPPRPRSRPRIEDDDGLDDDEEKGDGKKHWPSAVHLNASSLALRCAPARPSTSLARLIFAVVTVTSTSKHLKQGQRL